ncbi:retrovirus-related pol polyprotein from transposon TNT 1-94 [Tanacetum coccineum]
MRVRGSKTVRASRIVEDHTKKTLKTEHPLGKEASRLHSYEDPPESPRLRKEFVQLKKAINEEMVSLEKNQTWSLVRLPAGKKALQSKWVFRVKEEQDDKKRYKASLVVKGFQQKLGVDYNEIFSLIVKMTTIRAGYKRCAMDHCCYLKKVGSSSIILLLYVDDMLVSGSDMVQIKKLKRQLSQEFKMKDLGPAEQILGMSIIRDRTKGTLKLSQEKYIGKVLEKFNMKDAKARCQPLGDHFKLSKKQAPKTEASRRIMAKVLYALAVGSVMYAIVYTRLDIAHAVGVVIRFMSNPGREHWEAVNKGTLSLKKILGAKNPADMLTKVVTTEKLKLCAASTGLRDN